MPTYSAPIQPPTQSQLVDFRSYQIWWDTGTARKDNILDVMSPGDWTAPVGVSNRQFDRNNSLNPSIMVNNLFRDTYTAGTAHYNNVALTAYALSPLDAGPYNAGFGPQYAHTPTPDTAIGWRLDPTDTAGEYLGDYQVEAGWTLVVENLGGVESGTDFPDYNLPADQRPVLPAMTATLRSFSPNYLNYTGNGSAFTVSQWQFPGAPMPGTAITSTAIPSGPGYYQTASAVTTGTIVPTTDPLVLYVSLDVLESAVPPPHFYAHPPYYRDHWQAVVRFTIARSFRPQRYQWIYPDPPTPEVSYPIGESRRSANSAFLGRRR